MSILSEEHLAYTVIVLIDSKTTIHGLKSQPVQWLFPFKRSMTMLKALFLNSVFGILALLTDKLFKFGAVRFFITLSLFLCRL